MADRWIIDCHRTDEYYRKTRPRWDCVVALNRPHRSRKHGIFSCYAVACYAPTRQLNTFWRAVRGASYGRTVAPPRSPSASQALRSASVLRRLTQVTAGLHVVPENRQRRSEMPLGIDGLDVLHMRVCIVLSFMTVSNLFPERLLKAQLDRISKKDRDVLQCHSFGLQLCQPCATSNTATS